MEVATFSAAPVTAVSSGSCRNRNRLGKVATAGTTAEVTDTEAFRLANVDGSGKLTLQQYTEYMGAAEDDEVYVNWFNKHDKNGDGIITADEVRLE
ncbi:hypothetical protein SLS57_009883 [Botryosphaeria dothidea]